MSQSEHSLLEELDRRHVIHPITEFRAHEKTGPRLILGGKGVRVDTVDGRSVIDGFSGLWNINVGHGRTEIADAVRDQMQRLSYYPAFWGYSTEPAIRLAERLATFPGLPGRMERLEFEGGPTVILDHELDGIHFCTLYGHLSCTTLDGIHIGAILDAGDVLGEVGDVHENGGWPPHLHFQVIREMPGPEGDYPGVAAPSEREHFLAQCPDPNLILGIPGL